MRSLLKITSRHCIVMLAALLHVRISVSRHIETEKTRNRFTTGIVEVFDDLTGINQQWTGIKSLIRVERVGTRARIAYGERDTS